MWFVSVSYLGMREKCNFLNVRQSFMGFSMRIFMFKQCTDMKQTASAAAMAQRVLNSLCIFVDKQ